MGDSSKPVEELAIAANNPKEKSKLCASSQSSTRGNARDFFGVSVHLTFLKQESKELYVILTKFELVYTKALILSVFYP